MQVKDFFISFILLKSFGFNKAVARGVKDTFFSPAAEKSDKSDSYIKKKKYTCNESLCFQESVLGHLFRTLFLV